jgi:CDP-glycerol glycerophosphotransferase (TagB/SpsB family)
MMHHGPYPIFWKFSENDIINYKDIFRPDYLAVPNKKNMDVYKNVAGLKDTFYIGAPRYDLDWINYLENCALKVYKNQIEKPKDKTVLLYLMDIFKFDRKNIEKNNQYKFEIHKDILSMVNEFDNLQIWVKHHPRNPYKIPIHGFINKKKQGNIKQFGNDVDTNILLALSDICLATSSTTLINPLIQKRPVIFYDRWKEKLDAITIYDNLKYNASSREELKNQIKKILDNGYKIDDSYLKSFYKDVFSILSPSTSMTELYANKIRELIG